MSGFQREVKIELNPGPRPSGAPGELPPLDVTDAERAKGKEVVRSYRDMSGSEYRQAYAVMASWFYCRERQLRAALAKIATLEDVAETMEELSKAKLSCGHHYGYAFTDNGGKTGFCTMCRMDDLAAQVKKDAVDASWARTNRPKLSDCEDALRKAEAELDALREGATADLFSGGESVIVNNPRYCGKGIVQYDTGKRGRMVGVLLGNGNTWEYEFETITLDERISDSGKGDDKCEGEPCWRNPETGYVEYCPKHEAIMADRAMEVDAKRILESSPTD